jgi:hypothetical protein
MAGNLQQFPTGNEFVFSISYNSAPNSHATVIAEVQSARHSVPNVSTKSGIQIDFGEKQSENTRSSIWFNLESDSNVTEERDRQAARHPSHKISTEDGMQMDGSELQ